MTNETQRPSYLISTNGVVMAAAATLVLLGVFFQIGELGWGHFDPRNFWLFSIIGSGIWNMLALRMDDSVMQEIFRYWPLAIAGLGLAIFLAMNPISRRRVIAASGSGERDERR